jgi:hypothetical protein
MTHICQAAKIDNSRRQIDKILKHCDKCQRHKNTREKRRYPLIAIEDGDYAGQELAMDIVGTFIVSGTNTYFVV